MNARTNPELLQPMPPTMSEHHLNNSHLDAQEEETIFILREVAAAFERPTLLFSGGKDSLVMLKCAEKAFGKKSEGGGLPYPLLMIDTGHNFPEVTDFRDFRAQELGADPFDIFEMDADFSHNPDDLVRLYNACAAEGADLSIGSRYIKGVNVVNWPMGRVMMSYFASMYVRIVTRMPIRDTTAGFKCYTRRVLETIDLDKIRFTGYAFQIEMKFAAWKLGFKLQEVPIIFTDRSEGQSKMSGGIFSEAIFGVLAMKIKSFFKTYRVKKS